MIDLTPEETELAHRAIVFLAQRCTTMSGTSPPVEQFGLAWTADSLLALAEHFRQDPEEVE